MPCIQSLRPPPLPLPCVNIYDFIMLIRYPSLSQFQLTPLRFVSHAVHSAKYAIVQFYSLEPLVKG